MSERLQAADWEWVAEATCRLAVPGGWIYKVYHPASGYGVTFVPTPTPVRTPEELPAQRQTVFVEKGTQVLWGGSTGPVGVSWADPVCGDARSWDVT